MDLVVLTPALANTYVKGLTGLGAVTDILYDDSKIIKN